MRQSALLALLPAALAFPAFREDLDSSLDAAEEGAGDVPWYTGPMGWHWSAGADGTVIDIQPETMQPAAAPMQNSEPTALPATPNAASGDVQTVTGVPDAGPSGVQTETFTLNAGGAGIQTVTVTPNAGPTSVQTVPVTSSSGPAAIPTVTGPAPPLASSTTPSNPVETVTNTIPGHTLTYWAPLPSSASNSSSVQLIARDLDAADATAAQSQVTVTVTGSDVVVTVTSSLPQPTVPAPELPQPTVTKPAIVSKTKTAAKPHATHIIGRPEIDVENFLCIVSYQFLYDEFSIWGNNRTWDNGKLGLESSGRGLYDNLQRCGLITSWRWFWIMNSDSWDWRASGTTMVGKRECIEGAMWRAGAPAQVHCSEPA